MNYMGIDHHRQYSYITLMDEGGEVLRSGKVANLDKEKKGKDMRKGWKTFSL